MSTPKLCASGVTLRKQVDLRWPTRDKSSDGWIGDAKHAASKSDHNPDATGTVFAIDIDKDGIDAESLVRELVAAAKAGEKRIKYVIFNAKIYSSRDNWAARNYSGLNAHREHLHVSFTHFARTAVTDFDLPVLRLAPPAPAPKPAVPVKPANPKPVHPTLKLGSKDVVKVKELQTLLNRKGAKLKVDGQFGHSTSNAVQAFQKKSGLKADGVVGTATWSALSK
jgi:hypothetical protein